MNVSFDNEESLKEVVGSLHLNTLPGDLPPQDAESIEDVRFDNPPGVEYSNLPSGSSSPSNVEL